VGHAVADAYLAADMVDEARVAVVPNCIDEQSIVPDPPARAGARAALGVADEFLWVAAGRLEAVKDYPLLLRAMAELPRQARLAIAGCGSLEAELLRMCSALGLAQRVRLLGYQADIRPLLQAADGFVLCSKWEGLPVSLLEAGACALPCVCTDIPGIREILQENVTGVLSQPGEPAALTEAMLRVMSMSAAARSAMGRRARTQVIENFSLSRVLDRWEGLYSSLLERNGNIA
jgi:glycosyltransferase involved in cell wall biosynthesis